MKYHAKFAQKSSLAYLPEKFLHAALVCIVKKYVGQREECECFFIIIQHILLSCFSKYVCAHKFKRYLIKKILKAEKLYHSSLYTPPQFAPLVKPWQITLSLVHILWIQKLILSCWHAQKAAEKALEVPFFAIISNEMLFSLNSFDKYTTS